MADGDDGDDEGEAPQPGFVNTGAVSSAFSAILHNAATRQVQVTFAKDGRSYIIEGIESIEVDRWVNSGSPGGYFNSFVRGRY